MSDTKISICIPTYEMHGFGKRFLEFSLKKISEQKYKNFEVVISDHSYDNELCDFIKELQTDFKINYIKFDDLRGNSSANLNNCIKNAKGEYIKILFQDDFLLHENSLVDIVETLENNPNSNWLITACEHSKDGINLERKFYPSYNDEIHLNKNTISSPSVLTFKNKDILLFDENLVWLMDVDYYKRLHVKFGDPLILNRISVVNRMWEKQYNNTISQEKKEFEFEYVKLKKY